MIPIRRTIMSLALSASALLAGCAGSAGSSSVPVAVSAAPTQAASDAAIGRLADAYIAAWNAHDAHAFAQTYTVDADLTNVFGKTAHGRDGVEKIVGGAFGSFFGSSQQTLDDRAVRYLTPALASVDIHWSMTGATVPGWPALQHGLQSWTVVQQADGTWLIAVLHNMTLP